MISRYIFVSGLQCRSCVMRSLPQKLVPPPASANDGHHPKQICRMQPKKRGTRRSDDHDNVHQISCARAPATENNEELSSDPVLVGPESFNAKAGVRTYYACDYLGLRFRVGEHVSLYTGSGREVSTEELRQIV